jgi:hypothetical protein
MGESRKEYRDELIEGQDVLLDGRAFTGCTLRDCRMIVKGMRPAKLSGCTFHNVRWVLDGPAAQTIEFLAALYHDAGAGGRQLVEDTFDRIRRARQGPDPPTN